MRLPFSRGKPHCFVRGVLRHLRKGEESFDNFVSDYSMDALEHMRDKLGEYGFDVEPSFEYVIAFSINFASAA